MAQFDWGNPTKAPSPFDGQPYVDDKMQVWQWDAANQAWMKAPHLELRKVREVPLLSSGLPIGTDLLNGAKRTGTIRNEWDTVYQLSFAELWDASSENLLGRRAHMNTVELAAWMASVIPNNSFNYLPHTILNVFEIFDTRLNITRWNAWNGLFSSFRGRECYSGERGYGRYYPAQGGKAGYSDNFKTWHFGAELENELMNYFYGMTPGSSEPRACWTSGNKRTQSSIPRSSNGIIMQTVAGSGALRQVWNWGGSDWDADPGGDWEIFSDGGLIHQNPCHVYRTMNSKQLYFSEPRDTLRGCGALVHPQRGGLEGMLAFAIRNVNDPNLIAFLIKPLGVTKCAFVPNFDISSSSYNVMVVGKFPNRSGDCRFANLATSSLIEERGVIDGFRIRDLMQVLNAVKIGSSGTIVRNFGMDTSMIPEFLCFYMRHGTTGIRSQELEPRIKIERRKSGMPISFMDHR